MGGDRDRPDRMTSIDAMYLPVGDITGRAFRTDITARYSFNRTVGVSFGVNHFDIHVTDEDELQKSSIKYGYAGIYAGLIFAF